MALIVRNSRYWEQKQNFMLLDPEYQVYLRGDKSAFDQVQKAPLHPS